MEDYGYLVNEHEIECFSHSSSTDELVIRVKEVLDKLGEDLLNSSIDFERFVMIIEYNSQNELMMNEMEPIHEFIVKFVMVIEYNFQNELMMNEMEPIHEFIVKFVKDKKMCWGLSQHDDIEGVKITLVASK